MRFIDLVNISEFSDNEINNFLTSLIKQYLRYAEGCDFSLDRPFHGMTFEEWKNNYEPFSSIVVQKVDELLNDLKARKISELDKLHLELVQKFKEVKTECN